MKACRLVNLEPLPEPMLIYCWLEPLETNLTFESKNKIFLSWHFVEMLPEIPTILSMWLCFVLSSSFDSSSADWLFFMMTSSIGNIFRVTGPVTRSFDIFFDLRLNKRLSKRPRHRWFGTSSPPLWRHCNGEFRGLFSIYRWMFWPMREEFSHITSFLLAETLPIHR